MCDEGEKMAQKTNLKTWGVISVLLLGVHCSIAVGGIIYVDANAPPGGDVQVHNRLNSAKRKEDNFLHLFNPRFVSTFTTALAASG
jgi:hypothetical protein